MTCNSARSSAIVGVPALGNASTTGEERLFYNVPCKQQGGLLQASNQKEEVEDHIPSFVLILLGGYVWYDLKSATPTLKKISTLPVLLVYYLKPGSHQGSMRSRGMICFVLEYIGPLVTMADPLKDTADTKICG